MSNHLPQPTVKEFFRVFWGDLGARLSGALSVPFSYLAVFTSNTYTRPIYGLLAIFGLLLTIFQVWSKERKNALGIQSELNDEIAKRGRPEITLELQSLDQKGLHVCLMNYTNAPALNLAIPDIPCGNNEVLHFGPIPTQVSSGFSPSLQCLRKFQNGNMKSDISEVFFSNRKAGRDIAEPLQFSVRYSDVEGKNEWMTCCTFTYDFRLGNFVVCRQWVEKSAHEWVRSVSAAS